jgi:hypothetical protein
VAPSEGVTGGQGWQRQLYDWLANPLLIAIVGSLLVYLVIPQLTRGWQNHAKVLEVKTSLVADMSDSVGNATMTGRFIASGLIARATDDPNATQRAFNDAYQKWTIKSAVIGSQLAAYFPGNDLGSRWRSYSNVVTDFLQLSARGQRTDRASQLVEIADYFPALQKRGRGWWRTLLEDTGPKFLQNYLELSQAILSERDRFVQRVLDSKATGF